MLSEVYNEHKDNWMTFSSATPCRTSHDMQRLKKSINTMKQNVHELCSCEITAHKCE